MTDARNVLGEPLAECCSKPMTGFYRDGSCNTGPDDVGMHTVCTQVDAAFLAFSNVTLGPYGFGIICALPPELPPARIIPVIAASRIATRFIFAPPSSTRSRHSQRRHYTQKPPAERNASTLFSTHVLQR